MLVMNFILKLQEKYKNIKIIKTYNGEAVVMSNDSAKGVLIRGIDSKKINEIDFFKKILLMADLSDFRTEQ